MPREASASGERARNLANSGELSTQQVQQDLTAEQIAIAGPAAQCAAPRAQRLRLSSMQMLPPDDGVLSARLATAGPVVPAGQELVVVGVEIPLQPVSELDATKDMRAVDGSALP